MPTKVVVSYGIDPEFARHTQVIMASTYDLDGLPTPGRVACVDVPLNAADVAVDLLWAWTGICSVEGYNVFTANGYLYDADNPDVATSNAPLDITYDYSGTTGVAREGVSGQYIGLRSVSDNHTSSMLKFFYPGGNFCRLGNRFPTGALTGNGARLKQFVEVYSVYSRVCVSKASPTSTSREFSALGPFDKSAYHGVYNG